MYYGEHQSAEVRLLNYDPESCRVSAWLPSGEVNYRMGAPGLHMALNSVACLAVVEALGLTAALAIKQFPHFQPLPGRGEVLDLKSNERKLRVIDESYNANPISMRAALQLVREYSLPRTLGRRVLILGDMLELGPDALELHQALDEAVLAVAPDLVLLCGSEMRGLFNILRERCNVRWYAGAQEINREIPELLADGDIVLVKGSAGTGLSSTVNELKNRKW